MVQTSENCAGPPVAVLLRGRCPYCAGSSGFVQSLDKVVDMPVIVNDMCFANSEGASDSVHRWILWTFQLATEAGTMLSAVAVMAAMKVFSAF